LFAEYPTLSALAKAKGTDIMEIIRPLGTQHIKSANIIAIAQSLLREYNGQVPYNRIYLESLKGIGRKSTNVILAILYNENCLAVDTHVKRVSIRLGLVDKDDNILTIETKLTKKFQRYSLRDLHHRLVLFGRYYCTAKKPKCDACELKTYCKYKEM
jgi:endonuclease-3